MRRRQRNFPNWFFLFLLPQVVLLALFCFNLFNPLPKEKSFSRIVLDKDDKILSAYLSKDDKWRMETELEDVPADLVKAVIAKEDQYFYLHPGINPLAVVRALISNVIKSKRISGASTITMQLARLMSPAKRNYLNKLFEMMRAMQLEWHYPKKRILELYLSYVPFGGNVEGVKAASYIYFNRPPEKLSLSQCVLLSIIPNRPNSLRLDRYSEEVLTARNRWIHYFEETQLFPKYLLQEALHEPLVAKRFSIESKAPHFCLYMLQYSNSNEIKTNLNYDVQSRAEDLLLNHVNRIRNLDISNGAVLVINNQTMAVEAYCGSADFNDDKSSGQVNGIRANRSPGSTLKPFLYALAMDKGIITPKTKLLDVPVNYNGYEPENFDLDYRGDVTAEYALIQSLNIPAIRLLNSYGLKSFIDFLGKDAEMKWVKNNHKLGLSVILGGCGLTLEELTRAYTAFGKKGELHSLRYLKADKDSMSKSILSAEATWLTDDILSNNLRPDLPAYMIENSVLPKIAWKTGTSYGKKDAWAIGVSPKYTIGVWMGNFDGHGAQTLTGAESAVPLLFDLFNSIDKSKSNNWFSMPNKIYKRKVCRQSGLSLSQNCTEIINDYAILNKSSRFPCHLHQALYVDNKEDIQYCTACLPPKGYKKVLYPIFPAELSLWMMQTGKVYKLPPPHNSNCNAKFSSEGPLILSPSPSFEYFLDEDAPQQLLLQAASEADIHEYYWYIDKKFYKKVSVSEKLFFQPHVGKNIVSCMDDKGRTQSIIIKVSKL